MLFRSGEQKECPICGNKTEIYSRITGYYRPVQNWNDGKLQEYKNRTEYDIENSSLKRPKTAVVTLSNLDEDESDVNIESPEEVRYLFTTKTCPNCKLAKQYLANISYIPIDAEENPELALKYKVRQAPTLVVISKDQNHKFVNSSNIRKYVEELELMRV